MKIQKGDRVRVITGKFKGVEAEVERVVLDQNKIVVKGVNVVTRHVKGSAGREGGLIEVVKPIDVSNVMLICPKTTKPTRVGYKIVEGKKYRISKKSGEVIKGK